MVYKAILKPSGLPIAIKVGKIYQFYLSRLNKLDS